MQGSNSAFITLTLAAILWLVRDSCSCSVTMDTRSCSDLMHLSRWPAKPNLAFLPIHISCYLTSCFCYPTILNDRPAHYLIHEGCQPALSDTSCATGLFIRMECHTSSASPCFPSWTGYDGHPKVGRPGFVFGLRTRVESFCEVVFCACVARLFMCLVCGHLSGRLWL